MTSAPGAIVAALAILLSLVSAGVARAEQPKVIALRYDAQLQAVGFPSPVLEIAIDGKTYRLLVDTGASVHVLADWFVKAAGLSAKPSDTVHVGDSSGHGVDLGMAHNVQLHLTAGDDVTLADVAVMNFPAMFEQNGIAGAISPQLLAGRSEAAMLDLRKPELRIETMQSAIDDAGAIIMSVGALTKVCGESAASLTHRVYSVRAVVANTETSLVVDTGAPATSLREGTPVADAIKGRSGKLHDEMDVTGHRTRVAQSTPVKLSLGGRTRKLPVWIGAVPTPCGSQGTLGMDALKGCRLILGQAAIAVSCAATRGNQRP